MPLGTLDRVEKCKVRDSSKREFTTPSLGGIRVRLVEVSIVSAGSTECNRGRAGPAYPGSPGPEGSSGSRSESKSLSEFESDHP